MNTKNFIYSGLKFNGFFALFITLTLIVISILLVIFGGGQPPWYPIPTWLSVLSGVLLLLMSLISFAGFIMLEPNQARAMVFFGEYRGTFYQTGYWWVNPFMTAKKISLRASNQNIDPIKVNDLKGNPILIGLVLVWKIKQDGVYKAVFDIDMPTEANPQLNNTRMQVLEKFVTVQSDAALRQVAGNYPYDNIDANSQELTLRNSSEQINAQLEQHLTERLDIAGIEIVEARINHLAYAPEIAAVMLRRQQAEAIISAREKIVDGAVSMVHMALEKLENEKVVELNQESKAAMVSNLLVVLCSDEAAQPVVNTGNVRN